MDMELPLDFKEFLKLLNENGVKYWLIGGYAVGYHLGPAIPAADKALSSDSLTAHAKLLENAVFSGLEARFKDTAAKRKYKKDDVAAGREYVKSYVEYIHYVERIYEAAKSSTEGHYREGEEAGAAKRSQKLRRARWLVNSKKGSTGLMK